MKCTNSVQYMENFVQHGHFGQLCTTCLLLFTNKLKGGEKLVQIQKNSRQVPRQNEIVSNKDYCDLVYSWFQCSSELDEDGVTRYVPVDKINLSQIGRELGMDRRTVGRYVKKLYEQGLLEEQPGKTILKVLERTAATLVPYPTLRQIQNSLHRNSVSIFVYLLNRYVAAAEQPYFITYNELKKYIGISTATASNNVVVSDIMKTLKALQLIDYATIQTDATRCNIQIKTVTNVLPE